MYTKHVSNLLYVYDLGHIPVSSTPNLAFSTCKTTLASMQVSSVWISNYSDQYFFTCSLSVFISHFKNCVLRTLAHFFESMIALWCEIFIALHIPCALKYLILWSRIFTILSSVIHASVVSFAVKKYFDFMWSHLSGPEISSYVGEIWLPNPVI